MYLPDLIERMEASAERWAEEYIKDNLFKCGCGKMCELKDGQPISNNPFAPPVCPDCFEEWYDLEMKDKDNEKMS